VAAGPVARGRSAFFRARPGRREFVEGNIAAEISQAPGRNKSVAAIVARSGKDNHASSGKLGMQYVGARMPCPAHQLGQRDSRFDRLALAGADFLT
jgi:hypothetical protein